MIHLDLDELRVRFYDLMDEGQGQNYIRPELADQFLKNAFALFYGFIATEDPWRFAKEFNYSPLVNQSELTLPNDFMTALKVYAQPLTNSSLRFIPMQQFNASTFSVFANNVGINLSNFPNPIPRYRIMGNVMKLDPAPTQSPVGYNVVMWYVPQAPEIIDDGIDFFAGLTGHDQWIVNQAVIYAKAKEEVPFADLAAINAQVLEQIRRDIAFRNRGSNDMLLDTEGLLASIPQGCTSWH